jgi:hypothetical protein
MASGGPGKPIRTVPGRQNDINFDAIPLPVESAAKNSNSRRQICLVSDVFTKDIVHAKRSIETSIGIAVVVQAIGDLVGRPRGGR